MVRRGSGPHEPRCRERSADYAYEQFGARDRQDPQCSSVAASERHSPPVALRLSRRSVWVNQDIAGWWGWEHLRFVIVRVLLTGVSGTGTSALVKQLRSRDYVAYDADDDGFTQPLPDGTWGWRLDLVRSLFDQHDDRLLFFAGCSDEQTQFGFDFKVLLTAPVEVILERLCDANHELLREVASRARPCARRHGVGASPSTHLRRPHRRHHWASE